MACVTIYQLTVTVASNSQQLLTIIY